METDGKSTLSSNRKSSRKTNDPSATPKNHVAKPSDSAACAVKSPGKSVSSPAVATNPIGKPTASTATVLKIHDATAASIVLSTKRAGKAHVSTASGNEPILFRDVSLGPHEADLVFRLFHFWEARNPRTITLIGEEMLFIDAEGNVIQGFIPAGRVDSYLSDLVAGGIYRLSNFFGSRSKGVFRVADHGVTVSFSWNSRLTPLESSHIQLPEDRFRFHSHDEFESKCDEKGDLYGHMKLVNGQPITESPTLDDGAIGEARHILVHVQTKDGPVIRLYLWDKAATDFCQKFRTYENTPRVLLVTTLNPKRLGGNLALASMSSSRIFMEEEVPPTREYLSWLGSNYDLANKINAEVVTKPEKVTITELFSFIKHEDAKVATFECIATIDDVIHGSPWYYISCGGCNTKATKGPTSLICNNKKCEKSEVLGVPQYLTRISVYDQSEQAVFVLLGEAGRELTGKNASELVASYYEANESKGAEENVPVPNAILQTIGQTYNFTVKISDHNLTSKTQSITVTKVLPIEATEPAAPAEEKAASTTADAISESGNTASTSPMGSEASSAEKTRKSTDGLASEEVKRPRSG